MHKNVRLPIAYHVIGHPAYDCSHIEDVHLLYCACFINFISFLIDFFPSEMLTVDYIAKFGCNLISFLFI